MHELLMVVPSRSRPENALRLCNAVAETDPDETVKLVFAVDEDDPEYDRYVRLLGITMLQTYVRWLPMVPKLNDCAVAMLGERLPFIGFMGDDHLPRTMNWGYRLTKELASLGTGIVYANDMYQGRRMPTSWAMTADIVKTLGRMVPAEVEHLCCDNAILQLGIATGCIRYFPDVVIEHLHPIHGASRWDDQYERVNNRAQWDKDAAAYARWVREPSGLARDAAAITALREGKNG